MCICLFAGSKPIRGGIPLAFPQFADQGPLKLHGFAREVLWELCCDLCAPDKVVLRLRYKDGSDYDFTLVYSIALTETSLGLSIDVVNNSSESALAFTNCFHPYFRVADSARILIRGLGGRLFIDKADSRSTRVQAEGPLDIGYECESGGNSGEYFLDRIYANCDANSIELLECKAPGAGSVLCSRYRRQRQVRIGWCSIRGGRGSGGTGGPTLTTTATCTWSVSRRPTRSRRGLWLLAAAVLSANLLDVILCELSY